MKLYDCGQVDARRSKYLENSKQYTFHKSSNLYLTMDISDLSIVKIPKIE